MGRFAFCQLADDVGKHEERLVDVRRLHVDVFFSFDFTQSFTACQIYKVQSGVESVLLVYFLLDVDPEDGVRP